MNKYVIMVSVLVTLYMLYIYKQKEDKIKEIKPKTEPKKIKPSKCSAKFENPKHDLVKNLSDINKTDKVTLEDIVVRWSMNRHVIDADRNNQLINMIKYILKGINVSPDDFYIHTVENVYVMKDSNGNFRCITNFFIYDIHNHYQFKVVIDFVSINKELYLNYIDVDESAVSNIIDRYDFKYKSRGILLNHNTIDETVEKLFNRHYEQKTILHHVTSDVSQDITSKLYSLGKLTANYLPEGTPHTYSPMFCNKYGPGWNKDGALTDNEKACVMQNPSTVPYPNEPYDAPGVVTDRVDDNEYSWLYNPQHGNILPHT